MSAIKYIRLLWTNHVSYVLPRPCSRRGLILRPGAYQPARAGICSKQRAEDGMVGETPSRLGASVGAPTEKLSALKSTLAQELPRKRGEEETVSRLE